jgi:hypothetical protein
LTDDDKKQSKGDDSPREPSSNSINLNISGRIELNVPKPESVQQENSREQAAYGEAIKENFFRQLRKVKFLAGVLTLVVLGIYTLINYGLYRKTTEQLILSERPWIAMEVALVSPLTFTEKSGSMFVQVSLKNIGNSVAVNVHPFCKLGAERYGREQVLAFENQACDKLGEQTENDPHAGDMLFPNEPLIEGEGVDVSQKDIADAIRANSQVMKSDMGALFDPLLVCCVDYKSVLDTKHHQTRRVYTMGIVQTQMPTMWKGIAPKGTVTNAVLMQSFEGNYAD